jgi:integrase
MARRNSKTLRGIEERHERSCPGGNCDCRITYRASVMVDGQRSRQSFDTLEAAKGWRRDAERLLRAGHVLQVKVTVREAVAEWERLAEAGVNLSKSGDRYKPAAIRAYQRHYALRVVPAYGDRSISDLSSADWQVLVNGLLADEVSPSTICGTIAAVSALYPNTDNPTRGVKLPRVRNGRDRIASPQEAERLLEALPESELAIWATAMYAGLRRGELQALRVSDVRLADGVIDVEAGWDYKQGRIATKGKERRRPPIPAVLQPILAAEIRRRGRVGEALLFGATDRTPFSPTTLTGHADKAWKASGLNRITLHECRHTYASLMIRAGVNAKALAVFMGHSSIQVTFDRYGHLFPGAEAEAAALLDTYLAGS